MPAQLGYDADINEIAETVDASSGAVSYAELFGAINSVSLSAGGVPPSRQDFNALFALIGEHLYYMQQGGYYSYVDGQSYDEGAILQHEKKFYRSLVDDNTTEPVNDGENWEYVIDYDALEADTSGLILVAKILDKINGSSYTPADAESSTDVMEALESIYANTSKMAKTGTENVFTSTNEFRGILTAVTQDDGDSSTNVATTEFVQNALADVSSLPVGTILAYQGSTVPDGFLLCNGSVFSKINYPELYELLGTNTTPNLVNKFLMGSSTAGTSKSAGLPNLYGTARFGEFDGDGTLLISTSGVFSRGATAGSGSYQATITTSVEKYSLYLYFDASDYNSIYGNSTTVQPPALTTLFIICAK